MCERGDNNSLQFLIHTGAEELVNVQDKVCGCGCVGVGVWVGVGWVCGWVWVGGWVGGCECVSVCVRESVSVCVFVRECVCERERECECACVCVLIPHHSMAKLLFIWHVRQLRRLSPANSYHMTWYVIT